MRSSRNGRRNSRNDCPVRAQDIGSGDFAKICEPDIEARCMSLVRREIDTPDGRVLLLDSIMMLDEDDAQSVVVSSSHGAGPAAHYALQVPIAGVFFNDAGIGKDRAGVAGLPILDEEGLAAAAVSHTSARIGDVEDMWVNGIISCANSTAACFGIHEGMPLQEAARAILRRPQS